MKKIFSIVLLFSILVIATAFPANAERMAFSTTRDKHGLVQYRPDVRDGDRLILQLDPKGGWEIGAHEKDSSGRYCAVALIGSVRGVSVGQLLFIEVDSCRVYLGDGGVTGVGLPYATPEMGYSIQRMEWKGDVLQAEWVPLGGSRGKVTKTHRIPSRSLSAVASEGRSLTRVVATQGHVARVHTILTRIAATRGAERDRLIRSACFGQSHKVIGQVLRGVERPTIVGFTANGNGTLDIYIRCTNHPERSQMPLGYDCRTGQLMASSDGCDH